MSMGKVGTMIAQNIPIDIPISETGIQRIHSYCLKIELA